MTSYLFLMMVDEELRARLNDLVAVRYPFKTLGLGAEQACLALFKEHGTLIFLSLVQADAVAARLLPLVRSALQALELSGADHRMYSDIWDQKIVVQTLCDQRTAQKALLLPVGDRHYLV